MSRRYRCTRCGATVTVSPTGVLRRRLYLAATLAIAFVLYGVERLSQRAVRERLSPLRVWGEGSSSRWDALRDWLGALRRGQLFRCVRPSPDSWPPWKLAERAATTLAALAPPGTAQLAQAAFLGAARAG